VSRNFIAGLSNVINFNDHYLADWMVHPICDYKPLHLAMLDFPAVGVLDYVVRFDERTIGESIADIQELALPSLRQAKDRLGYEVRIQRPILAHLR